MLKKLIIIGLFFFSGALLLFSQQEEHKFQYSQHGDYSFEVSTAMTPNYVIHIAALGGLIDNPAYRKKYGGMILPEWRKTLKENKEYLDFTKKEPHPMAVLLINVPICMKAQRPPDYLPYFGFLEEAFKKGDFSRFWDKYKNAVNWDDPVLFRGREFLKNDFSEEDAKKWAKLAFEVSLVYAHNAAKYKREFLNLEANNDLTMQVFDLDGKIDANHIIWQWEDFARKTYQSDKYRIFIVNTLEDYGMPVKVSYNTDVCQIGKSIKWYEQTASHSLGKRLLGYLYDEMEEQYLENPNGFENALDYLAYYYNSIIFNTENFEYSVPQLAGVNEKIALLKQKNAENPDKEFSPKELMVFLLDS